MLMVSPITVRQWAAKGFLKAELTLGGHRRFLRHELERFARENGLTLQRSSSDERTRFLLVDGDRDQLRAMTAEFEKRAAVAIATATDGFAAGLEIHRFHPDVLFIDFATLGVDGSEVCRRLQEDPRTRGIRVIAVTAGPSVADVALARDVGAECCLTKPLSQRALEAVLGPR